MSIPFTCGESTSGCVRASVVDGCTYRYRMIVVEEGVFDRHEATHAINLFDMHQKYADVVSLAEVLEYQCLARQAGMAAACARHRGVKETGQRGAPISPWALEHHSLVWRVVRCLLRAVLLAQRMRRNATIAPALLPASQRPTNTRTHDGKQDDHVGRGHRHAAEFPLPPDEAG